MELEQQEGPIERHLAADKLLDQKIFHPFIL